MLHAATFMLQIKQFIHMSQKSAANRTTSQQIRDGIDGGVEEHGQFEIRHNGVQPLQSVAVVGTVNPETRAWIVAQDHSAENAHHHFSSFNLV